jgi:Rod binding domain-containing protein
MSFADLAHAQVAAMPLAKTLPPATPTQLDRIRKTAKEFESQLIGQMLQPMFEGLATDGEFDGGQAEGTYRSFMTDAFGKQMARSGGIGVAPAIEREMLKMQGLSEPAAA